MATETPSFLKIDPYRLGLSDCAAEIRNAVYETCLQGGEVAILPMQVGGRSVKVFNNIQPSNPDDSLVQPTKVTYTAMLLCSKRVYSEALPFLYNNNVVKIIDRLIYDQDDGWHEFRTSSLPGLSPAILSNIKYLSLDIDNFAYALATLNNEPTTRPAGGYITLDSWEAAIIDMPQLEVLTVQCHDWLGPRNLTLRSVTNIEFWSSTTEIIFEINVHEHVRPGRDQTEAPWYGTDLALTGRPSAITIPAVKKVVVVGWICVEELEELKKTTIGGRRFLESAHSFGYRTTPEARYSTGDHRFHEVAHRRVQFKGPWPRQDEEHSELDTEISRYTYKLATIPIEEGMTAVNLGQNTDLVQTAAAAWLRAL